MSLYNEKDMILAESKILQNDPNATKEQLDHMLLRVFSTMDKAQKVEFMQVGEELAKGERPAVEIFASRGFNLDGTLVSDNGEAEL